MNNLQLSCLHAQTLRNCCSGKLYPGDLHNSRNTSSRACEHLGPRRNNFCVIETSNPTVLFLMYFGTSSNKSAYWNTTAIFLSKLDPVRSRIRISLSDENPFNQRLY